MVKGDSRLDMRGRCSAGQKVASSNDFLSTPGRADARLRLGHGLSHHPACAGRDLLLELWHPQVGSYAGRVLVVCWPCAGRALVCPLGKAKLILLGYSLDEPTTNLDQDNIEALARCLAE